MKAIKPARFVQKYEQFGVGSDKLTFLKFDEDPVIAAFDMQNMTAGLDANDFAALGLDARTPERYATREAAIERVQTLCVASAASRPIAPYLVLSSENGQALGYAGLIREAQVESVVDRAIRMIKERIGSPSEDGTRLLTGWLRNSQIESVNGKPEDFASRAVEGMLTISRTAGLVSVKAAVAEVDASGSQITAIESAVDLRGYGFNRINEQLVVVEGVEYPSTVWERRF